MPFFSYYLDKITGKHRDLMQLGDQEGPYPKYKTSPYQYDTEVNCPNRLLLGFSLAVVGSFVLVGGYRYAKIWKRGGLSNSHDLLDSVSIPLMKSLLISIVVCPIVTTFPCWSENFFKRKSPEDDE